ncbi:hypothetical protein NMG60_11028168 [Bertholletia excelsa]
MIITMGFDFVLPSLWEVEVTVAAAAFVIVAYWFFTYGTGGGGAGEADINGRSLISNSVSSGDPIGDRDEVISIYYYFVLVNYLIPHCSFLRFMIRINLVAFCIFRHVFIMICMKCVGDFSCWSTTFVGSVNVLMLIN